MLASSRGRLSHIQSLEKRYDIRSAGAQCAPLRSLWGKRVLQYVLSVFCLPVRDPIPIFILIFYYIKVNEKLRIKKMDNNIKKGSIIFGVGDSHTSFIWNKK